ncbi:helix-turn-helix [Clostridium sp. CAG:58]|nr:helix-turn-helix [Clostridium sp. CAG:58]
MYEIFEKLLNARGITIYKFCKETGVSESTIYTWRKKKTQCNAKLQKIVCDYFGVTADYLMTGKEKDADSKYYLNNETAAIAQNIFENRELRLLFDAAKDAEPEDLETVHSMLLALKRKERGNID